jgi:hypothetical protein
MVVPSGLGYAPDTLRARGQRKEHSQSQEPRNAAGGTETRERDRTERHDHPPDILETDPSS